MIYKKIKRNCIIIFLSIIACICLFASCESLFSQEDSNTLQGELSAPKNVKIENETLVWDEVENATGNLIDINGEEYESETNSLDIFLITTIPKSYTMKVMALGNLKNLADSAWSETTEYKLDVKEMDFVLRGIKNNTECEILSATPGGSSGKLVIPAMAPNGIPITRIASFAFKNCTELTGVLVPSNIRAIRENAFEGCTSLRRVFCSDGLEDVSQEAFLGCTDLMQITLPDSVTNISVRAFKDCESLTNIRLPLGLTTLDCDSFQNCSSLTELYIHEGIKVISKGFSGCDSLTSITVAENNPTYKSEQNCIIRKRDNALISYHDKGVIPDCVKSISAMAFYHSNLTEIVIPGNVETIYSNAFDFCENLQSITFLEGVKAIGNPEMPNVVTQEVFIFCVNLTEINFPSSVEFIAPGITASTNVKSLIVQEGNPIYKSDGNCVIRKSDNELVTGCKASVIPDYVKGIGNGAFYGCTPTEVVIPNGVEYIGSNCFEDGSLEKISLPNTLQTIGILAFANNPSLKHVAIPSSVREIAEKAFFECYFLTVILPESVETIGSWAFDNAYIYTSASQDWNLWPKGWARKTNSPFQGLSKPNWHGDSSHLAYKCELGYDNGIPYVTSFTWEPTVNSGSPSVIFGSLDFYSGGRIPVREGYTFMGWATEPNSNTVVIGKTTESDGAEYTLYLEELKELFPLGAVLYAVWA